MSASPLKPRWDAAGVWTGNEMLVLGGRGYACDPLGCGPAPGLDSYAREVAAYDPARDSWRTLAPTPFPPTDISAVVLDRKVYVLTGVSYSNPRIYTYDLDTDVWHRLAPPWKDAGRERVPGIVAAGSKLYVWYSYTRDGDAKDLFYDPAADKWTAAPRNPLGKSLNHEILGLPDGRLVSFGADPTKIEGAKAPYDLGPRFYDAAVLQPGADTWERLPKAPFVQSYSTTWAVAGGRVVSLSPERADGYRHAKRTTYPVGGELDVDAKAWAPLPPRPGGRRILGTYYWATAAGGDVALLQGWALDVPRGTWTELPEIPGAPNELTSPAVAWTGNSLLAWGGRTHDSLHTYLTTNRGWVWEPTTHETS